MTRLHPGKTLWRVVPSQTHDARKGKELAVAIQVDSSGRAYIKLKVPKTRTEHEISVDGLYERIIIAGAR